MKPGMKVRIAGVVYLVTSVEHSYEVGKAEDGSDTLTETEHVRIASTEACGPGEGMKVAVYCEHDVVRTVQEDGTLKLTCTRCPAWVVWHALHWPPSSEQVIGPWMLGTKDVPEPPEIRPHADGGLPTEADIDALMERRRKT